MNDSLISELQKNNRLLQAILKLQMQEYRLRTGESGLRPELLLASYGLGYQEIASVLDKKPDAVRMLLKRNADVIKNLQEPS